MKLRKQKSGFTVIEVIVVLAIMGVFLLIAFLAFNGQSQKTQARIAFREFENKLQDISNDVMNGYYQKSNIRCTENPLHNGPPSFPSSDSNQGTNTGCIFLGKAIKLNSNSIEIFPIAGNRLNSSGDNVSSIKEAFPVVVASGSVSERYELKYGTTISNNSYYNANIYNGVPLLPAYTFPWLPTTPKCNLQPVESHLSGFIILYTLNSVPAASDQINESSKGSISTNIIPICRVSTIPDTRFIDNVNKSLEDSGYINNNISMGICLNNGYNNETVSMKVENNDIYQNYGDTNC